MATTTSRLQLVIAGDNKSAIRSIQGTEKAIGGLRGKLGGLAAGLAGGAIAAGSVRLAQDSVDAASSLYEQQTKVRTIFGESAAAAEDFAKSADKSYGQSERQALEAIGVFGNLFDAVGLSQGKSLEMSVTLDKLASDLASFNNVPVDDALTALRSGLVGEQEPLRRFGININEATLKQKALSLGLSDGKAVLSASAKAQAAYALILEQTTTAQGDFGRTADGLANQQRITAAEFENTKAALGESLLPVMKQAVGVLNFLMEGFGRLPGPVQTGAVAITALTLAVGFLGPAVATTGGYLQSLAGSAGTATAATGGLATAEVLAAEAAAAEAAATAALTAALTAGGSAEAEFAAAATARAAASEAAAAASASSGAATASAASGLGAVGTAGLAAAAGVGAYVVASKGLDALVDDKVNAEDLADALGKVGEKGGELTNVTDALGTDIKGLAHAFENSFDSAGYWDRFTPAGDSAPKIQENQKQIKALDAALAGLVKSGHAEEARRQYGEIAAGLLRQGVSAEKVAQYLSEYNAAQERSADGAYDEEAALVAQTEATEDAANATDDLRTATEKANDWAEKAIETQRGLTDARESYTDAHADTVRAEYELSEARRAAVGNSDEYRDAEEAVADAVAKVPEAQKDAREAVEDLNEARKDAADRLHDLAQAERDAALASADAQLKVKEALNEQRRINADPRSSALDKERAALTVAEAQNDARNAADEATKAQRDNAEAQRAGIEGDADVVRAKESVRDANNAVRDAVNGVRDAEANAAQIIQEAKAKVLEAQQAATDAALDEASAWGDLVEMQFGAVAGAQAYRDKLKEIAADLDPNSPLAQRIARLIQDINAAITTGTTRPASEQPNGGQTGTIGAYPAPASSGGRSGGNIRTSSDARTTSGSGELGIVLNQTVIVQGTPVNQRRAMANSTRKTLDDLARSQR